MQDIKAVTVLSPYCKNVSGGQEWPSRWDKLLSPVNSASSMRGGLPKTPLCPIVAATPLDLLHVEFTSIVLAFLTATKKSALALRINWKQAVQASRVAWEQMTLASLIDVAAWDSFWAEYYAQFPNRSPSPCVCGSFGVKQIIEGSVGISLELC